MHKVNSYSEEDFYVTPNARELSGYCPKGVVSITAIANQLGNLSKQLGTTELVVVCNGGATKPKITTSDKKPEMLLVHPGIGS